MILTCGEALIDMLPRRLNDGEHAFLPVPGGALFNTAIALARFGEETGFVSSISTDMFGEQLMDALTKAGVTTQFVVRSNKPCTLAFVRLDDGQAQYSFFDEGSAGRSFSEADLPPIPGQVTVLHFGGISLIPEPSGSTYETLMADQAHRVISIDPNIRPQFIPDAAAHRSRIHRMIAMSDIVKVSDEDLDWIGDGRQAEATIRSWLEAGTSIVLVTKGAAGVDVHIFGKSFAVPAPVIEVVDTIGAGDTFNAGFLSGLRGAGLLDKTALANASGDDLRPAVEKAVEASALACTRAGAG